MKVVNYTEKDNDIIQQFEKCCKELGNDEGHIQVSIYEYYTLLRHYKVKKPKWYQGWPIVNGVMLIKEPMAK